MEDWLDRMESRLDRLLASVKWDKDNCAAERLKPLRASATGGSEVQDVDRYQAVNYNPQFVPAAVAVRYENAGRHEKQAERSACVQSLLAFADTLQARRENQSACSRPLVADDSCAWSTTDLRSRLRFV